MSRLPATAMGSSAGESAGTTSSEKYQKIYNMSHWARAKHQKQVTNSPPQHNNTYENSTTYRMMLITQYAKQQTMGGACGVGTVKNCPELPTPTHPPTTHRNSNHITITNNTHLTSCSTLHAWHRTAIHHNNSPCGIPLESLQERYRVKKVRKSKI